MAGLAVTSLVVIGCEAAGWELLFYRALICQGRGLVEVFQL